MKKIQVTAILIFLLSISLYAQDTLKGKAGYQFTIVKELPVTPVKNQSASGTCWCFSAISFIESELLRTGKGEYDLSEMFVVSKSYNDRAEKYIRTHGKINFAPGSCFGDVLTVWKNYGLVPETIMPGLNYGTKNHVHKEMDEGLAGYVNSLLKNPNGKYTTAWKNAFRGILDAYLGESPQNFSFNGKEYTPGTFSKELGLNPDNYVSITSFTHHPFYTQFALEIPDNWRWDTSYNLPLDEMISIIDASIEKGYTVLWAADVSEKGFSRKGIAIFADTSAGPKAYSFEQIVPEKRVTQEERQVAFDNGQTTDDHGMHLFGIAKDQQGNKYYMVKNSWGKSGDYKGIWYVSEAYLRYKTISILVHKNAIPKEIIKKAGI
jgi:aminopeptidase C